MTPQILDLFPAFAVCVAAAGAQAFPDTACIFPQAEWQAGLPNSILIGEAAGQEVFIAFGYPNGGGAAVQAPGFERTGNLLEITWTEQLRGVSAQEMPGNSIATLDLRVDLSAATMAARMTFFNGPEPLAQNFFCQ